ncbi:hypothetical protein B0H17DRAFT_1197525 [Mycena rosella]|uniref:F-box domain-containing protein n=1 Tax=Mycena rosella TaxID=1033263 RepID=A0AAD7DTP4_MYCRO|nr:hypothetical protein B0H17DRAFT_1197525 [Mycena rosella]
MMGLPTELLVLILTCFFGNYLDHMDEFIDARSKAMMVCRRWCSLISSVGAFWSSYILFPNKKLSDFTSWTSRFPLIIRELRVYLDPAHTFAFRDNELVERLDIRRTTYKAVLYSTGCQRLFFSVAEGRTLRLLMRLLRIAHGDHLQSLSITRVYPIRVPSGGRFKRLLSPIFHRRLPSLFYLRLRAFVLSWTDLVYSAVARVLVFHDIMDLSMRPTWNQLGRVVMASPHLTRLSLRHFACDALLGWLPSICLPTLEELDMCFCSANTVLFLLSCDLPSLSTLSATFGSPDDMDSLLLCCNMFPNLRAFCPSGRCDRIDDILSMFRQMPVLVHLNLADASSSFMDALVMASSDGMYACPALRLLFVSDCTIRDIHYLIACRLLVTARLDTIKAHNVDMSGGVNDWIHAHVGELINATECEFDDDWIFHI